MIAFGPERDDYFLRIAEVVATKATCARRQVGCILVDIDGIILSTGYNGVPKGMVHCTDRHCPGMHRPSGTGLDACEAVHAEQNALIQCPDPRRVYACYSTASPCITCVKMLMNTTCFRVVFRERYPHPEAERLWCQQRNLGWMQLKAGDKNYS